MSTPDRVRADLARLVHRGGGARAFSLGATRILARSVPFDGVSVLTMDPATRLATGAFVENGLRGAAAARIGEIEYSESDVNKFGALARSGRLAASLSEATGGDLDRSLRHRELRAPKGFGDELRAVLVSNAATWGGLTLGRALDREPFAPAEVALVASLSGYLAEGLRRAMLLTARSPELRDDDRSAGLALLAADNSISGADTTAEAWLDELATTGPDTRVPPVVTAVASRARRIADGREPSGGLARARVRTPSGIWLAVRGSVLGHEDDAQTAVTLEPAGPRELAPLIADAYELTGRERAVTQLVALGLSTDAIADRLQVSPWTVQGHLKSIFEKVGVSSRGELVARIFFGHYAPRLTDGEPVAWSGSSDPSRSADTPPTGGTSG
jgi:DNA-binding CsgD family transcriptional regulator